MKNLLLYLITFVFLLLLLKCKKYDEGGTIHSNRRHLFGKKADGATKAWKLKLYEVDGIDSTYLLPEVGKIPNFYDEFITFRLLNHEDDHYTAEGYAFIYGGYLHNESKNDKNMIISLIENKFPMYGQYCIRDGDTIHWRNVLLPEGSGRIWRIKKLTDKELIITLSNSENNNSLQIHHSYKVILSH